MFAPQIGGLVTVFHYPTFLVYYSGQQYRTLTNNKD